MTGLNMNDELKAQYIDSAEIYLSEGNLLAAEQGFKLVIEQDETNRSALLGLLHISHTNNHDEAIKTYVDILEKHHSDDPTALYVIGVALNDNSFIERSYFMNPHDADSALSYAKNMIECSNISGASKVLLAINCSNSLELKLIISEMLVECSEIDVACEYLTDIIKARPLSWLAYAHALPLMNHKEDDTCKVEAVREILSNISTPSDKKAVLFNGLGKLLDKRGFVDEAWEAYEESNKILRKIRTNYTDYDKIIKNCRKTFIPEYFKDLPEAKNHSPMIFVFGMPRSGTTLTEQILGKHSDITALGEMMSISESALEFGNMFNSDSSDAYESPDEIAEYYMKERVESFGTSFCVDKMPGNFKYIPLIYSMFPNAKFIYCKRNALDNCFSCLTTLFAKSHDYSFNQTEMGKEYNHHLNLMDLWNDILPDGTIHTVKYEDMVSNQLETTKSMLDYIGLEYQEECKDFHTLKRNVKTASLAQVVKPMYTSSVNRHSPYNKYLKELIGVLNETTI